MFKGAPLRMLILLAAVACGAAEPPDEQQQLREAAASLNKAAALRLAGKKAEAMAAAERAVTLYREIRDEKAAPDFPLALRILGQLKYEAGQLDEANQLLQEAAYRWLVSKKEDQRPAIANLLDLGNLQKARGRPELAETFYRRAYLAQGRRKEKDDISAKAARALGKYYLDKGEYQRAVQPLRDALAIRRSFLGLKHADYAQSLNDLGVLYSHLHHYDQAERYLAEAAEVFKTATGAGLSYATCLGNLGALCHTKGDLARARELLQQSLEIFKKVGGENPFEYGQGLLNLGQLLATLGEYGEAEPLLRNALRVFDGNPNRQGPSRALALAALARVHAATGRPADAFQEFVEVLELQQLEIQRVFAVSTEPGMYDYLATIRLTLDSLLSLPVDANRTAPDAAPALTWTLRRKGIILETLSRFAEEQMDPPEESIRIRVRNLQGMHKRLAALSTNPGNDPASERQRAALAENIDVYERQLHRAISAYRRQQTQPFHRVDAEKVRARLPAGTALVEVLRIRVMNFKAKGKEPLWKPDHYVAFVVRAEMDAPVRLIDLGPAEAIDKGVQEFREKIQQAPRELRVSDEKTVEEDFRTVGRELYQLVFAPLAPALGKASTIYLGPDGELNRVPFEALVDPEERYLIETVRFAYLRTGRDLLPRIPRPRPGVPNRPVPGPGRPAPAPVPAAARGTVVFAGPDYDLKADQRQAKAKAILGDRFETTVVLRGAPPVATRGMRWQALPGAAAEADDVDRALRSRYRPVKKYVGPDALEEVFKALPAPRLLHIATHGFFLPDVKPEPAAEEPETPAVPAAGAGARLARLRQFKNPLLRSGIVLAGANASGERTAQPGSDDGWVTAEEIALMDLHGTELVVLSACETGLGDVRAGQGVYGLRHAFLYAGARSLVLSLFEVPDAQTREMMKRFYESLEAGPGKLDGLHQAKLDVLRQRRKQSGAAHPFFWASFILVGDPK